jgi:hypothetical protein
MWADHPGRDIGIVIERLLSLLDPRRLLLAGWLMAEGVSVPDHIAVHVIDRIFALVRNVGDSSSFADEGFEVLGALFDHPALPARLAELAGDTKIRLSCRVLALQALARLQGGECAQLLLTQLPPSVYDQDLLTCAEIAVKLGQTAVDMTRQRALRMVGEPGSGTNEKTNAAEAMRVLGLVTEAADLARSVLGETKSTARQLERVAEAWLAAQGESVVPEIAVLASSRPADNYKGQARLAAFLHKAGDDQAAESLADTVLDNEMADGDAIVDAARTLLSVRGAAAVPKVLLVIDRWSEHSIGEEMRHIGRILNQLAAYPEAAVASRASVLLERFPTVFGTSELIGAWLAVEPAAEAVVNAVDRGAALSVWDQIRSARRFQVAGEFTVAKELAERALRVRSDLYTFNYYEEAASVVLKIDRAAAVSQFVCWGKQNQESAWFAGVVQALFNADPEAEWAVLFCARKLVAHPRVDGKEFSDALGYLLRFEDGFDTRSVAEAV